MADKLIDIKDNGIDRFDRNALWDCVDVGIAGVKQLVEARYDDASPLANFGEASAIAVVRNEVVPLFRIGGAALIDTFLADKGKSPGPATDPSWRRLVPGAATTGPNGEPLATPTPEEDDEDPNAYTRTVERPDCFAACRSANACTAAYYHQASGQCYLNESKGGVLPGYKGPGAGGSGSDSLMIVAEGGAVFSTTRDPKTTELLTYESTKGKDGAGAAALMRADAARIIGRAVDLVRRYRFQLDILASRNTIDGELIKYYGAAQYEATISAEVDLIMEALRVRVAAERKAPAALSDMRFMHPDRVADRIRLLPDRDASDVRRSLAALRTCILSYTKMFPAFESEWYKRVSNVIVLCGNVAMCVGFLVYLLVAYTKTMTRPDATLPMMIQMVVVVFCIYAISISVVETMLNKAVSKDEHNTSKIQQNGQILTAVSGRFVEQYDTLVKAIRGDRDGTRSRAAAATLLSDGKLLLEKYEQCNTVTHGQVSMPLPLAEIVTYALVALVFLGVTVIVVSKVSPGDRITNIRVLQSLGARIDRGDAAALIEASSIIECARPNMHIWNLFTWFGILVFATITVWFVIASQTVASDYRQSLLSKKDCA
jgi:NADH:ubiquinone oxidoreductase subunit 6 (subunit J)